MDWNAGISRIVRVSLMGATGASALMSASACSSSFDGKSLARDVFYGGRALNGEADVTFSSPSKQFIDAL